MRWRDRIEAGQELAKILNKYRGKNAVVYGLPRGGVVLAAEVARELNLPLDLAIARKIGHPFHDEYAIGAVTEKGKPVLNEAETAAIDRTWLRRSIAKQRAEAERRRQLYLRNRASHSPKGKIAILVDDGIATGLTMRAAINAIKDLSPSKIVAAVPVAPDDTASEIENEVDELVILQRDKGFLGGVGNYYERFEQTEDEEVIELLDEFEDD